MVVVKCGIVEIYSTVASRRHYECRDEEEGKVLLSYSRERIVKTCHLHLTRNKTKRRITFSTILFHTQK